MGSVGLWKKTISSTCPRTPPYTNRRFVRLGQVHAGAKTSAGLVGAMCNVPATSISYSIAMLGPIYLSMCRGPSVYVSIPSMGRLVADAVDHVVGQASRRESHCCCSPSSVHTCIPRTSNILYYCTKRTARYARQKIVWCTNRQCDMLQLWYIYI